MSDSKPTDSTSGKPKASGKKRGGARSTTRRGNGVGMGDATGAGWGGPAKGVGSKKPRKDLTGSPGPGRGKFSVAGEERKQATERRISALMEHLWHLSFNAQTEPIQVQATVHLLNRIQGLPVQTVLTSAQDDLAGMSDDELAADIESRARKLRALQERVVGANLPTEFDGLGD